MLCMYILIGPDGSTDAVGWEKKLVKSSKYAKFALVNNFFVVIDIFSPHV